MAEITIKVPGYRCERCGHEWVARSPRNVAPGKKKGEPPKPRQCPACKSAWWDVAPQK
jgi:predicted Zn-ribbon and HTH transcriptional regulator